VRVLPRPAADGETDQPRRGMRQGTFEKEGEDSGRPCGCPPLSVTITTLGNGYLGSCIDEERSEMRYLV
jgi:hypothetical protein